MIVIAKPSTASQVPQPKIPVFHFHRRPYVHLHADQALEGAVRLVVVDHGAHQVAVQNVNEHVAAHDQVVRIPIGGNEFGQILGLA